MSARLWAGAGVLAVSAFAGKQVLFSEVSSRSIELRSKEHEEASLALNEARENAKKYTLPPLTIEEKKRLKELLANDPDFNRNEEFDDMPSLASMELRGKKAPSGECCSIDSKYMKTSDIPK